MDNNLFIINDFSTIREALITLDKISANIQSLLVVNKLSQVIGTLSDGDIRRGLINGAELHTPISSIMHRDFRFLYENQLDVEHIRFFRKQNILFVPVLDNEHKVVSVLNLYLYKSFLPIDAVLMAGGKGERLRPLTEKTPKPLLPVGDKAIIDHIVEHLISYGIKNISVTVNYLKEQIEDHFAEPYNGVQVRTYREPKFQGTIGSIKFIQGFEHDVVLLMNSDVFTNIDYEDFFLHFQQHDAEMSVAVIPYSIKVPYGIFDIDGRNIKGLIEKPTYNYYANAGIYLIKRRALDEIPKDTFFNATDLIEKLVAQGKKIIRYPLNGTWIDIGNSQEYEKANELIKHLK